MKKNKTNLVPVPELKTSNLTKKLKLNYLNYGTGTGTEWKTAFTLVELIVVITILAILWTIAFISLSWYSKSSRDSVRISDVSNMKTSLELFHLNSGKYPLPDDYGTFTYSWNDLFYQWYFWDNVIGNISRNMSKVPTDPLTEKKYIYSVSNNKNELEILVLLESDDVVLNTIQQTNAVWVTVIPKIIWNYNKLFVKTVNYIVPIPSIINTEVVSSTATVLDTNNIKSMVTHLWKNIPEWQWNVLSNTWALTWLVLTVYNWIITKDSTDTDKALVMKIIQDAYSWSVLAIDWIYKYILNVSWTEALADLFDTVVLNETTKVISTTTANNWTCWTDNSQNLTITPTNLCTLWTASSVTDNGVWFTYDWTCDWDNWWTNATCNANHVDWRWVDTNCDIADVIIWTQTWAGCNSTLWTSIEYGVTSTWAVWTVWSCYDYDWYDSVTWTGLLICTIDDITMSSNTKANTWFTWTNINWDAEVDNIWWKYYTWDNSASACVTWYHVPTDAEWEILETTLNWGTNCRNATDWWLCDWLWRMLHSTKNTTNNIIEALQLPLSGYRITDGVTFNFRGNRMYLWSSTEYDATNTRGRSLSWYLSTVDRSYRDKSYGFSVRCLKD